MDADYIADNIKIQIEIKDQGGHLYIYPIENPYRFRDKTPIELVEKMNNFFNEVFGIAKLEDEFKGKVIEENLALVEKTLLENFHEKYGHDWRSPLKEDLRKYLKEE